MADLLLDPGSSQSADSVSVLGRQWRGGVADLLCERLFDGEHLLLQEALQLLWKRAGLGAESKSRCRSTLE